MNNENEKPLKITREHALRIMCQVTDRDNFWEMACESAIGWEGLENEAEPDTYRYPSIYEVMAKLGVTRGEVNTAAGIKEQKP